MKKVLLCVMDGVGCSKEKKGNAFYAAKTPNLDFLIKNYSYKEIEASGKYVGLPDGQIGNSEVGHLTIGAGRIVYQPLSRITNSINDGSFYTNEELLNAINHAKTNNSKLHIIGLLSDGGVHSHIQHLLAILEACKQNNFSNVYFHVFTDGRDTNYKSAMKYLDILQNKINDLNVGSIASICGRFYGMDRDNRWDRIEKAYKSIILNDGEFYSDYKSLVENNYSREIYDEFIIPGIIDKSGNIEDNDSIVWSNFRTDRAWEILSSIYNKDFDKFETKKLNNVLLTTLMWVSDNIDSKIIFKPEVLDNTLGIYLSKLGKKQLRIAETEKYAHVTYFFDGQRDLDLPNCKRVLIPSPKVLTYDLAPKMSAEEITNKLLKEMDNSYDFIFMNFANGDMLGHTGDYDATIIAMEEIDKMIGRIFEKCEKEDYLLIITADHGNCETMLDENGIKVTKHTTNKVPFIVCEKNIKINVESLSEVAPFVLNQMNIEVPKEMK